MGKRADFREAEVLGGGVFWFFCSAEYSVKRKNVEKSSEKIWRGGGVELSLPSLSLRIKGGGDTLKRKRVLKHIEVTKQQVRVFG